MARRMWRVCAVAAGVFVAAGCALGPAYERDDVVVPPAFINDPPQASVVVRPTSRWWDTFGDPLLSELVDTSRASNRNLMVAAADVRRARELLLQARLDRLPVVPVAGG